MNTELKQLIEDAAKLLGYKGSLSGNLWFDEKGAEFRPCDPERGDLWKVAEAAGLLVDFKHNRVVLPREDDYYAYHFTKGDYQSLVLAVLRAVSAVLKARGE
jgi:hypothetical protein